MKLHHAFKAPFTLRAPIFALLILLNASPAVPAEEKGPEDQLITLEAKNKPLGQVLAELQQSTGTTFSLDDQWKDVPVTISLINTPLTKGLKRMLTNYNSIVIYDRKKNKIQIRILGKVEPGAASRAPMVAPPVYRPEPEPEIAEEAEPPDSGTEEAPAEESAATGQEPEKTAVEPGEAPADKTDATEGATEETTSENPPAASEEKSEPESGNEAGNNSQEQSPEGSN